VNGVVARSLFRRAIEPSHLVEVRMLLGGLALLPLAALRGSLRIERRLWPGLLAYAFALAMVQVTYFEAIALAGVAVAIFLQYTAPLLVAAFEAVRGRRLPPRPLRVALLVAVAGSALLVLPGGELRVPRAGVAFGLAAAVSFASATVIAGELRRTGLSAMPLLGFGLTLGSVLFWPVHPPLRALTAISAHDWPFFLYVAFLATALPFTLYASALVALPGSVAMLLAMLEPALAAALAWIALGEALSLVQVLGGVLILGAIALAARSR
jgi:drug/metabolite transporter (DMT)-like permease